MSAGGPRFCPRCNSLLARTLQHEGRSSLPESIDEAHYLDACPLCNWAEIPPGGPPLGSEQARAAWEDPDDAETRPYEPPKGEPDLRGDPQDPDAWGEPRD